MGVKKGGTGLIGPDAPVISGTEKNQKVENVFGKLYCFHLHQRSYSVKLIEYHLTVNFSFIT